MDIVDAEELLRSQSLYEMITHTKKNFSQVGEKKSGLKAELRDFAKLQERLSSEKKLKETVRSLARAAPKDIGQLVNDITSSSSKYVNYSELEKLLLAKDFDKLRSPASLSSIIDKERIFQDLRRDPAMLQSLLKDHKQLRLDVVSLAEAREKVANAPTSASFDERLQSQMKLVLDFV